MEMGWPSMAGFGFNAANAPADDAQAIDHRGVAESVPNERVGVRDGLASHFGGLAV